MFRKKIITLLTSIAIIAMTFVAVQAEEQPTISVGRISAAPGSTVSVPISISGNTGICGAKITVNYDSRLDLNSIGKGSALSSLAMTPPGNLSANPFNIVWDGMESDNSNGTVVLLNFTVPNEQGTFNVSISYNDGDIVDGKLTPMEIITQNGSITSGESGGEGGNDDPDPGQNDNVTISVDSVTANSGGSIDVPIRITNNTGICGATISVAYDSRLKLTKISKGEAFATLTITKPGNLSANPAKLVWDGMDEDYSDGIIATLTFDAPNTNGAYDIALSYEDRDIVDGNLAAVNPVLENGQIKINGISSYDSKVNVAGQSVTLTGQGETGKILVAFYKADGTLLDVQIYNAASNINAKSVNNAAKAKIMWWNELNNLKPVCTAQIVNINQ